jgi:hypothetical protein
MKIRLRVRESPSDSFDWEHTSPALCIGRADDCQLVFHGSIGEIVSSKHLQIELSAQGAIVTDLDSTNGTYLNGTRLTAPAPLRVGDHLQLGLAGPRLEVLALDLHGAAPAPTSGASPTGRASSWLGALTSGKSPRTSIIVAGAVAATVVGVSVLWVLLRRPADSSNTKVTQAASLAAPDAASPQTSAQGDEGRPDGGDESPTDKAVAAQTNITIDTDPKNTAPTPKTPLVVTDPSNGNRPESPPSQSPAPPNDEPSPETAADADVGRLVSDHDVLLHEVDDEWQRLANGAAVSAGDRLLALPSYRPSLALTNGVTLQLLGGAVVSLGAPQAEGGATVHVLSGRVVLVAGAQRPAKVQLQAGDYQGTLEFAADKTPFAVEVRRLLPDGSDPEQDGAPTKVDVYLSSGEATWVDEQERREKISGPWHRSLGDDQAEKQAGEKAPAWLQASALDPAQRRASTELENSLQPDEPVAQGLRDLSKHRQLEISLLAVQSMALIDDFEPLVPMLNDAKYRSLWTADIESLRTALARSPQSANALRVAFASARGRELGGQLYRLLWGFTSEQLENGEVLRLIDWLDAPDKQLDFRVLSFWNLHHFTGLGLNYQPAGPEKQRRASIQRWKQKLESGLIVPQAF